MSLTGYMAFYASTWEEYHTGTLYLDYISGPVEGAWAVVFAAFFTFLAGDSRIWGNVGFFDAKNMVVALFVIGSLFTILTSIRRAHCANASLHQIFKDWASPIAYFTTCSLLALVTPKSLSIWFIFLTGLPACFRISSTIVAHITKSSLRVRFYPIEYVPLVFLLFYRSSLWVGAFQIAVIGCFIVYLTTMVLIISDICNHLNISCLTIKGGEGKKRLER